MQRFFNTEKGSMMRSVALSLIFSSLFIAVSVGAATTISTSITTDGALSVTGASTLTGLTTMVYASSTGQSLTRNLMVNGMATTTGASGNVELRGGLTVGNATTNSLAGTILFSAQSSDPTGVTQGTFYYNSTSKVLKMYDGSDWFTVGTTTSGISLSGSRLQLADLTLQYLTIGTTTQQGVGQSMVTLEATSTTAIPLSIVGRNSQTGHLLDVLNGSVIAGPKLLYISSSGGLFASSTGAFGGTLTVGGELTATSTLNVTGRTTMVYASSTGQSLSGNLTVTGTTDHTGLVTMVYASSTGQSLTGNLQVSGFASISTTTATTTGEILTSSTATTSLMLHSSSATNGGCIEFQNRGSYFNIYATTTGYAVINSGRCE